jgi:hypothetical protein
MSASDAHRFSNEDLRDLMAEVARRLLDKPNRKLSSGRNVRYGERGSLSVDVVKGPRNPFLCSQSKRSSPRRPVTRSIRSSTPPPVPASKSCHTPPVRAASAVGRPGGRSLILESRPDGERGAASTLLYFYIARDSRTISNC